MPLVVCCCLVAGCLLWFVALFVLFCVLSVCSLFVVCSVPLAVCCLLFAVGSLLVVVCGLL